MQELEIRQEARFVLWAQRCCAQAEELQRVQALAETAEALNAMNPKPAAWWRGVVANEAVINIDALARTWLRGLLRAGIRFPTLEVLLRSVDVPEPLPATVRV